jgi:hypothetical protein
MRLPDPFPAYGQVHLHSAARDSEEEGEVTIQSSKNLCSFVPAYFIAANLRF